jgi:predicted phosphodiesterase
LAKLPKTTRIPIETGGEILLVHGSPLDPSEPISHELTDEEVNALIADDPADIIVCGASHVPFDRIVGDTRIVNVGSVGEAPGGQHAHATFLETSPSGVVVEQFVVPLGRAA